MSVDVVGTVGSGAGKVGRYFTVVSALPAAVFVSYIYLLLRATDWLGPVNWSRLNDFRPQEMVILGIVVLILALALNPVQFPLIQLFEGYWGTSALAVELATIRVMHHRRRRQALEEGGNAGPLRPQHAAPLTGAEASVAELRHAIVADESARLGMSYPDRHRVLPTRLGNVLRRYEDGIRRPYGLDPLSAVPRLAMVAGQPEMAYLENQRVQMELALRTSFLALLATPLTVVAMWHSQEWLLLAAAPYAVAFLTYRGAVALAHEYGTSLAVLTDMTRFALYERLRLPQPSDTLAERQMNEKLMHFFALKDSASLTYRPPEARSTHETGTATSPADDPQVEQDQPG